MVEIKSLTAGYFGKPVLQNLRGHFPAGKVTAILGPNGCGKSTLLKALSGVLKADGQVLWQEKDLLTLPPKLRARQVACLHQSPPATDLTAQQLALCGRYPYQSWPRTYTARDEAVAAAAMKRMGVEELKDRPLSQLSGGQQQKVHLAMALAQDAPILLLDEPTSHLDISHQLQLLRSMKALAAEGKTVVAVLHDLQSALGAADHILLMEEGRCAVEGTPEAVYASGQLEQVFGVRLLRVFTDGRPLYYCEEA